MNEWLTTAQVADLTQRHPVTVRKALEGGVLHGHQVKRRGRWSVARAAVDAWLTGGDGRAACGCDRYLKRGSSLTTTPA